MIKRRTFAPALVTVLAGALLLPLSSASAAPAGPQDLKASSYLDYDDSACTMDSSAGSNDSNAEGVFLTDGTPATQTIAQAAEWHENGTPANTIKSIVSESATTAFDAPGGALKSFDFAATASITTTVTGAATNSVCKVSPQLTSVATNTFTLPQAGWLTVTVTGSYGGPNVSAQVMAGTTASYNINTYASTNASSTNTTRAFLPAGQVFVSAGILVTPGTALAALTQSGAVHVTGTFEPLGVATALRRAPPLS